MWFKRRRRAGRRARRQSPVRNHYQVKLWNIMKQRDNDLPAQTWTWAFHDEFAPFRIQEPWFKHQKKQKAGFRVSESTESPHTNSCPGGCLQLKEIFEFPTRVKTSFGEDFLSALTCWLCCSERDSKHAYSSAAEHGDVGFSQMVIGQLSNDHRRSPKK